MATSAQYAATPKVGAALLTTADTSLTAPTTVGTLITAASSGTRIDYIEVIGVATTAAGIINLFLHDGSTYHLWQQVPIIPITTSTTAASFVSTISSNGNANVMPLCLPTGWSLRATTTTAQTGVKVIAYGGDF